MLSNATGLTLVMRYMQALSLAWNTCNLFEILLLFPDQLHTLCGAYIQLYVVVTALVTHVECIELKIEVFMRNCLAGCAPSELLLKIQFYMDLTPKVVDLNKKVLAATVFGSGHSICSRCLTRLCRCKDYQRRPPPVSRLGPGSTRAQSSGADSN